MAVTIIEGAFKVEQCDDDSYFWDLYQKKNVKHKDGTVTAEWKIRSYGIPLSACVNKIALLLTAHKLGDEAVKMKDYLKAYQESAKEIITKFDIANLDSRVLNRHFMKEDDTKSN